jgi:CBS domain-containing protein
MRPKDVMTHEVDTVGPDDTVSTVAEVLWENHISAAPVVGEDGNLLGIISEGDLMRRLETGTERVPSWWLRLFEQGEEKTRRFLKSHGQVAKDIMTTEVVTIDEDTPVSEIAALLEERRIKRVPVLANGRLVGIVSRANLLHALAVHKGGTAPARRDDEELRSAVSEAIGRTGINKAYVNALVSDGVATLMGAVDSEAEKKAVRVAAETTPGVKRVDDRLGILPRISRPMLGID